MIRLQTQRVGKQNTESKICQIKEIGSSNANVNVNWYTCLGKSQALIHYEVIDAHKISCSQSTSGRYPQAKRHMWESTE